MWLVHGTTRLRAEAIVRDGPDPFYAEGGNRASFSYGLSTYDLNAPSFALGRPEDYAKSKAKLFPNEGGPAILEVDVPEEVVQLAMELAPGLFQFDEHFGMAELLEHWPLLTKRVRNV
jgi:hypothetical protein